MGQSVKKYAMVKALKDSMVFPNEGEHWGSLPDGSYGNALPMKETKFYSQDLFGLKEVDAAGKLFYETTPGDHLEFTDAQLYSWIDKYFLGKTDVVVLGGTNLLSFECDEYACASSHQMQICMRGRRPLLTPRIAFEMRCLFI